MVPRTVAELAEVSGAPEGAARAILAEIGGYDVDPDTGAIRYRGIRVDDVCDRAIVSPECAAAVLAALGWRVDPAAGLARWERNRSGGRELAKLTDADALGIRKALAEGEAPAGLAVRYGVSVAAILAARAPRGA